MLSIRFHESRLYHGFSKVQSHLDTLDDADHDGVGCRRYGNETSERTQSHVTNVEERTGRHFVAAEGRQRRFRVDRVWSCLWNFFVIVRFISVLIFHSLVPLYYCLIFQELGILPKDECVLGNRDEEERISFFHALKGNRRDASNVRRRQSHRRWRRRRRQRRRFGSIIRFIVYSSQEKVMILRRHNPRMKHRDLR